MQKENLLKENGLTEKDKELSVPFQTAKDKFKMVLRKEDKDSCLLWVVLKIYLQKDIIELNFIWYFV